MPWFPDFAAAGELARRQTRAAGRADPVGQYLAALNDGDSRVLETVWPGEVVIHDPRVGEVRGHRQLRRFVRESRARLARRHTRTETVAATCVRGRAVVELVAHLADDGREVDWPLHHSALDAGDVDAVVHTFAADGYYREPTGRRYPHRELRSFFTWCFGAGGGIGLQPCAVTDDGVRCAVEYNCVRWGSHELPPQAGMGVYERGPDGLLTAVRVYDDVEAPVGPR
jgi:ketosteroid isomerase-like protein